jgi:hypothetical protein
VGSLALRLLALVLLSGQAFICNLFATWPDVSQAFASQFDPMGVVNEKRAMTCRRRSGQNADQVFVGRDPMPLDELLEQGPIEAARKSALPEVIAWADGSPAFQLSS